MKAKLFGEGAERFWQAFLLFLGTIVLAVWGVSAAWTSVFSTELVAGPDFIVTSPDSDVATPGTVRVTPTELDDTSLRVWWGLASAAVFFGLALFFLAALRLFVGEQKRPIFGSQASVVATGLLLAGGMLILGGSVARDWMAVSIGRAAGIPNPSSFDGASLWIFEVPAAAYAVIAFSFGWVWKRGNELQEDVEQVV